MNTLSILFSTVIVLINATFGFGILVPLEIAGSRDVLPSAKVISLTNASGPESVAFDLAGEGPYVGVSDGRVLKWLGESLGWTDFAYTSTNREMCVRPVAPELEHVCGRPLGLQFNKRTGDLYIADAYFGLLVVGPSGGLAKPLVTEAEGVPFRFTNDLDIDEEEDVIYFTDTSIRFQRRQFLAAILSGDKTGKLINYDRSSKKATVLLRGLAFANGVALSKHRSFVLVAETTNRKILRFWLSGPKTGTQEVFAQLPGLPDNIKRNSKGEFWVALNPSFLVGRPLATAMKLSESGEVLEVLEDTEGKTLRYISEVNENDGKLWIGSVLLPFLGVYDLYVISYIGDFIVFAYFFKVLHVDHIVITRSGYPC